MRACILVQIICVEQLPGQSVSQKYCKHYAFVKQLHQHMSSVCLEYASHILTKVYLAKSQINTTHVYLSVAVLLFSNFPNKQVKMHWKEINC